jgi:prophage regulatory protein
MRTTASISAVPSEKASDALLHDRLLRRREPIRMLRLNQVIDVTGLGKTKIYELQADGDFPMRVKITTHSAAWIEEEVKALTPRNPLRNATADFSRTQNCTRLGAFGIVRSEVLVSYSLPDFRRELRQRSTGFGN